MLLAEAGGSVGAVAGQEHRESHDQIQRPARDRTDDDEDPLPAAALLFRVRWWRRLALPGQRGDPLLLVPALARPARGTRPRQKVDRRAARRSQPRTDNRRSPAAGP